MPISLRSDASGGGNQVAGIPVKVFSDIADPIERVKAIHRETVSGKEAAEKLGLDMIMNVLDMVPPRLAKALIDHLMLPKISGSSTQSESFPAAQVMMPPRQGHVLLPRKHPG